MARYQAPKGTQDLLPEDLPPWQWLESHARALLLRYGYGEIRTPFFESVDLFARSVGEATDIVEKEMFTVERGGDAYGFRPEGTAAVVRAYLQRGKAAQHPFQKLFYIGPMFRYERPQAGRLRQFHQIGVEVLGSDDPRVDIETIDLAHATFSGLGLRGVELRLNSMGCPVCRPAYRQALHDHLAPRRAALCGDCRLRLEKNVFRVLDCKKEPCRRASSDVPSIEEHLDADCAAAFAEVRRGLEEAAIPYRLDHRLVRGLDYYTRTVYEFHHPRLGARSAICGGGRYDGLIRELGGPDRGACGFAMGMETILLALAADSLSPPEMAPRVSVYVAVTERSLDTEAMRVLRRLRRAGLAADTDYEGRSLKSQMKVADRLGVCFVVLLGPEEVSRGEAKVRDMRGGEETAVALDALIPRLGGAQRAGGARDSQG